MGFKGYESKLQQGLSQCDLIYVQEEPPGIKRRRCGRGFSYIDKNGVVIRNEAEKARLKAIAVPPTYEDVWYCPLANGHLQATGLDSTSKKQYFYHVSWSELRNLCKYSLMTEFAEKLPSIRRKITEYMKLESHDKNTILAVMIRLLDSTGIRVGSTNATEKHQTYGITTLKNQHVSFEDDELWLEYDGKGQVHQEKLISDKKVIALIQECVDIPGQTLFQYEKHGEYYSLGSSDVNQFIQEHMGSAFSAKDFRTWRFSSLFLQEALRQKEADNVSLTSVLEAISKQTGNTTAVLKSSYIHPALLKLVKNKDWLQLNQEPEEKSGLRKVERILFEFIQSDYAKLEL
ncbi:MAG: DNA topoisomerase IB [Pseudomonadota bacterium]|nr:DNA topoisomerase IB [Pseudomonadota bacterium]